jgi:uncharacterized Tic20 family protein
MVEVNMARSAAPGGPDGFFPFISIVVTYGVLFLALVGYILFAFVGAGMCLAGRDLRVPFLGRRLARYVLVASTDGPSPVIDEERGDRWVAAMSHASIVMNVTGAFLPLLVWFTERKRSAFLNFQGLQAALFQLLGILLFFAAYAVYLFGILVVFVGTLVISGSTDSGGFVVLMVVGLAVFLLFLALALLVPLLQILGQWAALQILRGHDYEYPLIGRRLRAWQQRRGGTGA